MKNIKVITKEQKELFNLLQKDREESARVLEKPSMVGVKKSLTEKYSESAHFLYELLQNADDAKATMARFILNNDGLIFAHDGTTHFSISDPKTEEEDTKNSDLGHINSITSIGNTTKFESQIGKFGIGFKAVFEYTNTPHVYDPPYMFKIERFIVSVLLENDHPERIEDETLFYFPFDSEKKKPEIAYQEINKRLQELDHSLLFLRNLEKIEWEGEQESSGTYLKLPSELENQGRVISLSKEINNQWSEQKFLIFDKKITDDEQIHVINLAYNLALDEKQIVSPRKFPAYCFFTTREHTELKFIINAPFLLTDNREGVKEGQEWNSFLIKEAAALVAESLPKIKMMGLLVVDFLKALPISKEDFPDDHMFRPIYDAVLERFKSDEKLLPANDDGYTNAQQAFLGRGKELIDLLGTEQLSSLFEKDNAQWIDYNVTENSPLWDYLSKELEIPVIRSETMANRLNENFMKKQTDEWVIQFYSFLLEQKDLWDKPHSSLRKKKFIRLSDDTHVAPFHENGKPQAYLPSDSSSSFPTVKKTIVEDDEAKEFLEELKLTKPDNVAEVIEFVLPQYEQINDHQPSEEDNLEHTKKILRALETDSENKRKDLIERLKGTPFLLSYNDMTGKKLYKKPSEIYLSEAYTGNIDLETYFEGYSEAFFPSLNYKDLDNREKMYQFFLSLEVESKPRRIKFEPLLSWEEKKRLRRGDGCTDDIESIDYALDGLEYFLRGNINVKKAVILWNYLLRHIEVLERWSFDSFFKGKYRWFYYSGRSADFDAKFLRTLRQNSWLPDKDGNLHKPSEISLVALPEDFEKESKEAKYLAESLGFKRDIEQDLISKLSPEKRELWDILNCSNAEDIQAMKQFLKQRSNKEKGEDQIDFEGLNYKDELAQAFNRHQQKITEGSPIPTDSIPDPKLRRGQVKDDIRETIKGEPPLLQRFKRVPAKRWEQKNNEVRTFLREQYWGKCQICGYTFPKRDGDSYFEGLYLVSRTKAAWIDRPGNVLCLCANCCAKFEHGQVEAEDILSQINNYRCLNEGGDGNPIISLKLCGEEVKLKFSERHILDLQEVLKVDE